MLTKIIISRAVISIFLFSHLFFLVILWKLPEKILHLNPLIYGPFLLEQISYFLTTKSPEVPDTHLIDFEKMKD